MSAYSIQTTRVIDIIRTHWSENACIAVPIKLVFIITILSRQHTHERFDRD